MPSGTSPATDRRYLATAEDSQKCVTAMCNVLSFEMCNALSGLSADVTLRILTSPTIFTGIRITLVGD